MIAEDELIRAVQRGNVGLFPEIVSLYQRKVVAVALKVTKHPDDAEDVAQEVFIQMYKSIHSFQFQSSFSTWVYRITMNKALDWKRKYEKTKHTVDITRTEKLLQMNDFLPEQLLLAQDRNKQLELLIEQLPEKYQLVIRYYYFQEKSYQEVAEQLGIAVKTVESRLYRAKDLLRKIYKKEEEVI